MPKVIVILFLYIIATVGVPGDLVTELTHYLITGEALSSCNCTDDNCLCEASCCKSEEVEQILSCCDDAVVNSPPKLAKKVSGFSNPCNCGPDHPGNVVASSYDTHFPVIICSIYIPDREDYSNSLICSTSPPHIEPPEHIPLHSSA